MIVVRPARDADEVRAAARFCWPAVAQGQGVFGLAGSESAGALAEAWLALQHHRDHAAASCGLACEDEYLLHELDEVMLP